MKTHTVMSEVREPITHCYFVNSGLASVLNVMRDGKSVEVGLSGKRFCRPTLGRWPSKQFNRVVTQVAGTAFRISAANLKEVLPKCPQLERKIESVFTCFGDASHAGGCLQSAP